MLRRLLTCLAACAAAAVLTGAPPAMAGGGGGWVTCAGAGCNLSAAAPGSPAHPASAAGKTGPDPNCYIPASGGGLISFVIPACPGQFLSHLVGLPAVVIPVLGGRPAPPAVLAAQAESQLRLGSPVIRANPPVGREQLVRVPTWLWLAGGWHPVTATAAVPGENVTATAVPQQVRWDMGDGAAIVCHGPGTAYPPGGNPAAASPDCGYTYTYGSAAAPGGAFQVTATITWQVTWAGGGAGGAFGGLTTTAAVAMRVAQSQAIVTGTTP
jgi:hypothetical protein